MEPVWVDIARGRGARERACATGVPEQLPLLDPEQAELLRRWVRNDGLRRSRAALLKDAGAAGIERAEALCEQLLRAGWLVRHERLLGGRWQWDAIGWRDLGRLQLLLGVDSPRLRGEQRQAQLREAQAWLESRRTQAGEAALDPDLLQELEQALRALTQDTAIRLDVLETRLALLQALAAWHDSDSHGSRRDFALRARGTTKSLTEADWRWLETAFDLERLRIARFAPVAWLAGDLVLQWDERQVDLGGLHCLGLPLSDLLRATSASPSSPRRRGPTAPESVSLLRYWLIENRASFERQAQQLEPGHVLLWLPGRPSAAWLDAVAHLLTLAPAPAWISADADPAGVDIACTAGALWSARGLDWEPYRMGVVQLQESTQQWPLNEHDRALLLVLLGRAELPVELRALCEAMQREGRKAEQEGWL